MRPIILKFLLPLICIAFALQSHAQTCNGSLGDPVINQNFGSGPNPGTTLAPGLTTLTFTPNNCPDDGQYTIANSLVGSGNCHPNTWHNVPTDHTGNPNGYMMIVNASQQPSIFFTQTASGLCPNTTYEFSSFVLNLIKLNTAGPGVSEPNILFTIETPSGQILATDTTGTIPPTNTPQWNQYGTFFTTPANVTDVIVVMTNLAPGGNGNDLILDDITFRACGPIIQAGFTSTGGPLSVQLCEHSSATYTLKTQVQANPGVAFQWQSNNGSGWVDLPAPAGTFPDSLRVSFLNATPGTYQYRLGVSNGSNISAVSCRVYSSALTVTVNPLPVLQLAPTQTICQGNTLQLTGTGGATYVWSGPNLPPTAQNPLVINNISPANAGIYTVTVTTASGCSASAKTTVIVLPKVTASISSNVAVCAGDPTQLSASGGLHYKWTPSAGLSNDTIPNPIATPLQTTTYRVAVDNGACVDSSKSVTVTVNQLPMANAGSNQKIFEGQSTTLTGTAKGDSIINIFWTPATGLSNPSSLTPIASPTDDITYTLNVVSKSCGTATSSIFVRVYQKITIPNTFTPNSDGINDNWDIDALVTYPDCSVLVYNRYGQKVYQSTGYPKPWDGTFNGSQVPAGTYYYVIDLKNNTPKIAGWVLIVR